MSESNLLSGVTLRVGCDTRPDESSPLSDWVSLRFLAGPTAEWMSVVRYGQDASDRLAGRAGGYDLAIGPDRVEICVCGRVHGLALTHQLESAVQALKTHYGLPMDEAEPIRPCHASLGSDGDRPS